jgi:hypothetical protein
MLRFGNKVTNFGKKFTNKRPFEQQGNNQRKQVGTVQRNGNPNEKSCFSCGKKGHVEKDYWHKHPQKRYFNCGDPNHLRNECPKLK